MVSIGNDKLINSLACFCYNEGCNRKLLRSDKKPARAKTRRS